MPEDPKAVNTQASHPVADNTGASSGSSSKKPAETLHKRQLIDRTNRSMFLWIAGASVIVMFAIVASVFLGKQVIFKNKIIAEKSKTSAILNDNIDKAKALNKSVNDLEANPDLASVKTQPNEDNLQVIFDALPWRFDGTALGASLQTKLLDNLGSIESLNITALSGDTSSLNGSVPSSTGSTDSTQASITGQGPQETDFNFTLIGSDADVQKALERMEKSILPIQVTSISLQASDQSGKTITAIVNARTFYQPVKKFMLTNKVVHP